LACTQRARHLTKSLTEKSRTNPAADIVGEAMAEDGWPNAPHFTQFFGVATGLLRHRGSREIRCDSPLASHTTEPSLGQIACEQASGVRNRLPAGVAGALASTSSEAADSGFMTCLLPAAGQLSSATTIRRPRGDINGKSGLDPPAQPPAGSAACGPTESGPRSHARRFRLPGRRRSLGR